MKLQVAMNLQKGMIQNFGAGEDTSCSERHVNKINSFGRGSHRDYKWGLPNFQSLTLSEGIFWSDEKFDRN